MSIAKNPLPTVFILAMCLTFGGPPGQAESCYMVPGRGYTGGDCNAVNPAPPSATRTDDAARRRDLRQQLRAERGGSTERADRRAQDLLDAAATARLNDDLDGFRSHLQAAILAARSPALKAHLEALLQQGSGPAPPGPPQPSIAATPAAIPSPPVRAADPDIFIHCSLPDRTGTQVCYEAPRRGLSCRKTYRQGGEAIWTDDQPRCDSVEFLEQRNRHFTTQQRPAAPQLGTGEARAAELVASLTPECRARFEALLNSAEQRDSTAAVSAYAQLEQNCAESLRAAALQVEASLPQRHLSERAQRSMAQAFSNDPLTVITGIATGYRDIPQFDGAEVLNFGMALLRALSGLRGAAALRGSTVRQMPMPMPMPRVIPAPPPSYQAPITQGAPPARQSGISGSTR